MDKYSIEALGDNYYRVWIKEPNWMPVPVCIAEGWEKIKGYCQDNAIETLYIGEDGDIPHKVENIISIWDDGFGNIQFIEKKKGLKR